MVTNFKSKSITVTNKNNIGALVSRKTSSSSKVICCNFIVLEIFSIVPA